MKRYFLYTDFLYKKIYAEDEVEAKKIFVNRLGAYMSDDDQIVIKELEDLDQGDVLLPPWDF